MEVVTHGGQPVWGIGVGMIVFVSLLFVLLTDIVAIVPFFWVFRKAGWHWAMGFLMLLPIVNLVMLYVLAFARWPVESRPQSGGSSRPRRSEPHA